MKFIMIIACLFIFVCLCWLFFACSKRIYNKYYPDTSKKLFVDTLISEELEIDELPEPEYSKF